MRRFPAVFASRAGLRRSCPIFRPADHRRRLERMGRSCDKHCGGGMLRRNGGSPDGSAAQESTSVGYAMTPDHNQTSAA